LTAASASSNNADVSRLVGRAVAALVAAPFLILASGLAPQHVHEPRHSHDHAVAHSHFSPHDHADDAHSTDAAEVEHDGAHVVWLDSPVLHEPLYQAGAVPPAIPVSYDIVPAELRWSVTPFDHAAPVHGPPKLSHLLRGPPRPA